MVVFRVEQHDAQQHGAVQRAVELVPGCGATLGTKFVSFQVPQQIWSRQTGVQNMSISCESGMQYM